MNTAKNTERKQKNMTDLQSTLVSNEVMQQTGIDLCSLPEPEAVVRRCFVEKVFLEISRNSQENICARASFLINLQALDLQLYQKETLTQVLSCEFCQISKNTIFYRTPPLAASIERKRFKYLIV